MARFSLSPQDVGPALNCQLVVVIPVYNEENAIEGVVQEWSEELSKHEPDHKLLLINDGSRDDTQKIIERLEAIDPDHIVTVQKPNSGHGNSCRVGYDLALGGNAPWIFQIDSDGQCDPAYFEEFWSKREAYDYILGVRKTRDDGLLRRLFSTICWLGCLLVARQNLYDPNVPYRLMRREALQLALRSVPGSFFLQNIALSMILRKLPELKGTMMPIHFRSRNGGEASAGVIKIISSGFNMLCELAQLKVKR